MPERHAHGDPGALAAYRTDFHLAAELLERVFDRHIVVIRNVFPLQRFLEVRHEFGTFDRYIWGFVGGKPLLSGLTSFAQMPARTALSDAISEDLKARGFKFVGSTVVYSHMQATGMVNDHLVTCFRYRECAAKSGKKRKTK